MKRYCTWLLLLALPLRGMSQEHHPMQHPAHTGSAASPPDTTDSSGHETMPAQHASMAMTHAFSLSLPMNRNGSGTGWLPDAAPMYGSMYHRGPWMFMLHGNAFLRYNKQDVANAGSRGAAKIDAPNWLMFMGQRRAGRKGLLHINTMFSLDALFGGAGYPLLYQSGEAFRGKALVDRQHPHDLFSELSVSYSHAFSRKLDLFVYVGYPGEPALGPVAFMHRPAALFNPDAPVSHHWLDATHITFGVATLGLRYGKFKGEVSSFTGREPDEHRYGFDRPRFDSRSFRLSFNPGRNWALQASHAFIKHPEVLHEGDLYRSTASAVYSRPLHHDAWLNATLAWGLNKERDHQGEHALLAEAAWNSVRTALYGRYEFVQKSGEELSLDEGIYGHDALFPVHTATLGGHYSFARVAGLRAAAGAQVSTYLSDSRLATLYGRTPVSFQVYLRIYPALMKTSQTN